MRARLAIAAAGAAALIVTLGACSKVEQGGGGTGNQEAQQTSGISTNPRDSMGPAEAVPGGRKGGTLFYLRNTNFSHLDPQRQYSVTAMAVGQMYSRTLTSFKELGNNKLLLVGDTAEGTGTDVNKDCKTWEFKIKHGLKWDDGTDIKAQDIAYGIARSFNPDLTGGPSYLQEWLANDPQFDKVWDFKANKDSMPPGLTTPDDFTLRMAFQKPRCDLPYAAALPFTAPVPKAKDTGVDYDNQPSSSGPYKVTTFTKGTEIILERNPNWDANTDPIRNAYPDKIHIKFGITAPIATNRIIADVGDDKNAAIVGIDPALVSKIAGDASVQSRVMADVTPFLWYMWINNQKVTDVSVRRALNYTVDRDAYIKSVGGDRLGQPGTTLLSPQTVGWESYDSYPAGATGNPDKAKELLAGKTPALTLAFADDPTSQQSAVALKTGLERAGFKITLAPVTADAFLDKIGEKANPWDIYVSAWAADWPTALTTIPILFDGRNIRDTSNANYSYLNEPSIGTEIDRIATIADPTESAKAWAALDKKIMTDYAPCVPLYTDRDYLIEGSNVGGLFNSDSIGTVSFVKAFLKS